LDLKGGQKRKGGQRVVNLFSNKKGQSIFFILMIGVVFFLLGLALTPALVDVSNEAMASPEINCSSDSITDQDKAVCTSIDIQSFLFFGTIFGLGGSLFAKILL